MGVNWPLSPRCTEVFDLESEARLARLDFPYDLDSESLEKAQVFFASDGKGISIKNLNSMGPKHWHIVPTQDIHHTDDTEDFIRNRDDTISLLRHRIYVDNIISSLPMALTLLPAEKEPSNQTTSTQNQSYRCDEEDEWILDQDGRRVLWIPPDERPRRSWNFTHERKIVIGTEGVKVYSVEFSAD
jgi:hypothetical protein